MAAVLPHEENPAITNSRLMVALNIFATVESHNFSTPITFSLVYFHHNIPTAKIDMMDAAIYYPSEVHKKAMGKGVMRTCCN